MSNEPQGQGNPLTILSGLEGIDNARTVQPRDKTTLDTLISVEKEVIATYSGARVNTYKDYYPLVYEFSSSRLSTLQFDESDVKAYVMAMANNGYELHPRALLLGSYTGCLLQILTERNTVKGKRTRLHINGNGNRFDYLFFGARTVDELIVDNFKGSYLCSNIGGEIGTIVVMNCEGDGILYEAVRNGNAELIIGVNVVGNDSFGVLGHSGYIKQLIMTKIKGGSACKDIGVKGRINQAIGVDLGNPNFFTIGYDAKVNQLVSVNVTNIILFHAVGERINQAVCDLRPQPEDPSQIDIINTHFNDIIQFDAATEEQKKIVALVRSMPEKTYEEILRLADEIFKLRPPVPDGFFERK